MKLRATLTTIILTFSMIWIQGCSGDSQTNPLTSNSPANVNGNNYGQANGNDGISFASTTDTEFHGIVESVDVENSSLAIVGLSTFISVLENAEIVRKGSGEDVIITLSDILPGDSVEARGTMAAGDTLMADRIRIREEDAQGNEVEFHGTVESVDSDARIILLVGNAQPITVDVNAEIVSKNSGSENAILLSEILPGDSVEIRANELADGTVLANRVRVRTGGHDFRAEIEFKATISMIDYDAGMIFFDSVPEVLLVDSNTFIFMDTDLDDKGSSSFASSDGDDDDADDTTKMRIELLDLNAGDFVEVHANRIDADTLYAVAIEVEDDVIDNRNEVQFKDIIATIDYETGVVTFENSSLTGTVVEGALLTGLLEETIAVTDFAVGNIVEVKGFKTSETEFDIVRMEKEDHL